MGTATHLYDGLAVCQAEHACDGCRGKIEQQGTPIEIRDAPATPFVMNFIADVNQLPVTCQVSHLSDTSLIVAAQAAGFDMYNSCQGLI